MPHKDELGRRGEALAVDHLTATGFEIIERNWRSARGELDIIARDGAEVVVVEVKTRSNLSRGNPLDAITGPKLARLRRLAREWASEHGHPAAVRIDAIGIVAPTHGLVEIDHVRGVF
ncbi:YraN family protein [Galbitalea soli]|uniref:UPF0102 protein G3T37_09350 n=1 Tax=Galbitalea soli TaxID=1268042 RepID=A0A7C9TRU5_9MICO|nr:YraN family protein [Galbitalea soli]NEM91562.1 YraN family protein [Galbitalea soli]NYJ30256.1 putative endonuclease [Galbitalea soli]